MSEPLYAGGATKYDQLFAQVTRSFIPSLLSAAQIVPGHRVLDVATGTGAAAEAAAGQVGPSGEGSAIKLELFDGQSLPFPDNRFDRVICQMGLQFFDDPSRGLAEFHRVLVPDGRTAVVVNSTPERSLFTRIGTVIARHVPAKAEMLNRYASIRTAGRLRSLLEGAAFASVEVRSEVCSFTFASFDDYFSGTAAGAGISGQEYVKLPEDVRDAVRTEVRLSFPEDGRRAPFVVDMEVLVGSGRK